MPQFYVQVPATEMFPEDSLEFFETLDDVERYVDHLLKEIFPESEEMVIYKGMEQVSTVVRMPSGYLCSFREEAYLFA